MENITNYLNPLIYLPISLQFQLQLQIYSNPILKTLYNALKLLFSLNNIFSCELVRLLQLNEFYNERGEFKDRGRISSREFLRVEEIGVYLNSFVLVYIERYLNSSKVLKRENKLIKQENPNITEIVRDILIKKQFPGFGHPSTTEAQLLNHSITLISHLNSLKLQVNNLQKLKYNSGDYEHEKKLLELWNNFNPDEELDKRFSNKWKDLGFQGEDPATDFRGMGMLGLQNLLYFSKNYPKLSKKILLDSRDETYWYPLAIVGINLTSYCLDLLLEEGNLLNCHLFKYGVDLEQFNEFYCYSLYKFNEYWLQSQLTPFLNGKPFTVMDFELALELFKKNEYCYLIGFNSTNLNELLLEKGKKID